MAMPPPPPPPPRPRPPFGTGGDRLEPPPSGKGPRGWMFWTWVVCWCGFMLVWVLRLLGVGH